MNFSQGSTATTKRTDIHVGIAILLKTEKCFVAFHAMDPRKTFQDIDYKYKLY
jgi:hypothetical protein